jgi:hypothetical protein
MNRFLANAFSRLIGGISFVSLAGVALAGIISIGKGEIGTGLAIIVVGTLFIISLFGALSIFVALYEEVKLIKKYLARGEAEDLTPFI